jgi:hypothetical protein
MAPVTMVCHCLSQWLFIRHPTPPDNQSAFVRLKRDFYQNSSDVVQSDSPLVLMPVVGWGDSKRADDSKWVAPSLFDTVGRSPWARRRGRRSRRAAARSREGEELSSNPFSVIWRRGSRTPSWSWLRRWSSGKRPLFCPRSARAAAASGNQAQARRINLRGCAVADRARSFGHYGGGQALESCGLVIRGLERERRHSANAGHRHQAAAHLVVPGHRQPGPLQ